MTLPRRFTGEHSEGGETLIEVLLSTALMATVVVAVIGGMATLLIGSRLHRAQTDANTALVASMERLRSTDVARACATNDASHPYRTGASLPSSVNIQSIEYETIVPDGSGNPSLVWSSNLADCSLNSAYTLQRITLKYTSTVTGATPATCTADQTKPACLSFIKGDY